VDRDRWIESYQPKRAIDGFDRAGSERVAMGPALVYPLPGLGLSFGLIV